MINAAVVGLGTWGKTMVESLAGGSDLMRFTTLQTRTVKPDVEAFAKQHSLEIADSFEAVLSDPKIDAVVLATPPSGHLKQIAPRRPPASTSIARSRSPSPSRRPRPRSTRCARPSASSAWATTAASIPR